MNTVLRNVNNKRRVFSFYVFIVLTFYMFLFTAESVSADENIQAEAGSVQAGAGSQQSRIQQLEEQVEQLKKEDALEDKSLTERIFVTGIILLVVIVLFIVLGYALKRFEDVISEKEAIRESEHTLRLKTIVRLFHWAGSIVILGAGLYMVLENFGINVAPLLAGAGIAGLAFGFGGQYLIRDLINGIFILLEGHYNVNDVVKIGEYTGVVENINLRITTLRDFEGKVIIIPNGEIKTVVNQTKDFSRAVLSIGVAYKENVDHVMDVIKQIGKEIRQDEYFGRLIIDDLEMLGVDDFAESQVVIKFRVKTLPIKQWEVSRELRRRIKNRFDELGIEIPFPHRTVYWGTGKENDWFRKKEV